MISKQEYQNRQKVVHTFESSTTMPALCVWCSGKDTLSCHQMEDGDLVPSDDEVEEMQNGLGSIATLTITREYLASGRSTLWGQSWNIKDKKRREEAARWLAREVDRINAIRNMAMASSSTVEVIVERARRMEI